MLNTSLHIPIQLDDFVDRQDALAELWRLARGETPTRMCILQAAEGMGKTYLLNEFQAECKSEGLLCARLPSGKVQDINSLSLALNIWDELRLGDPKTIAKALSQLTVHRVDPSGGDTDAQQTVFGNIITGHVGGDVIYKCYMQVVLKDDDRTRQLFMGTVTDLLERRLKSLAAKRRLLFIVDPWDAVNADDQTGRWLLDNLVSWVLSGELPNAGLVIAGIHCPVVTYLQSHIQHIELGALPDDAVESYWVDRNHLELSQVGAVIEVTNGIPLALSLTVDRIKRARGECASGTGMELQPADSEDRITSNATRALLDAMCKEEAQLVRLCAIPHWFDEGICSYLAQQNPGISGYFKSLIGLHFVEGTAAGSFTYKIPVRRCLLEDWWQGGTRDQFISTCRSLLGYVQGLAQRPAGLQSQMLETEEVYLSIIVDERSGIDLFCERFERACCSRQYGLAGQYIILLREVQPFIGDAGRLWLEYFEARLQMIRNEPEKVLDQLAKLIARNPEPVLEAASYWSQGMVQVQQSRWSEAARLYSKSLKLLGRQSSALYSFLVTLSLAEAYQDLAANSGSLVVETDESQQRGADWLSRLQSLPFLAYEWLVHRWSLLPNWFFGTNYQEWIIAYLFVEESNWSRRAADLAARLSDPFWKFEAQLALATAEKQLGRWSKARVSYTALSSSEHAEKSEYRTALIGLGLGEISADDGRLAEAISSLEQLLPVLKQYLDHARAGIAEARLSQLYQAIHRLDEAVAHANESVKAFAGAKENILATLVSCRLQDLEQDSARSADTRAAAGGAATFEHRYLTRFPDVLLAWYRRIALWGALPFTYVMFIILSVAAATSINFVEGEIRLWLEGKAGGTTIPEMLINIGLVLLPVPLTLWLYRLFYGLVGSLVAYVVGRRLIPIEKEQPTFFLLTGLSLTTLEAGRKPRSIPWPEIKAVGVERYGLFRERSALFSRAFLVLRDGSVTIVEGVTSAFDHLQDEVLEHLRDRGVAFEQFNADFRILDLKWLAFSLLLPLAATLERATRNLLLMTYQNSHTGEHVQTLIGPAASFFLPTFALLFLTITLWRALAQGRSIARKISKQPALIRAWPLWIGAVLSTILLLLWLAVTFGPLDVQIGEGLIVCWSAAPPVPAYTLENCPRRPPVEFLS